jgi:hypothetical protein
MGMYLTSPLGSHISSIGATQEFFGQICDIFFLSIFFIFHRHRGPNVDDVFRIFVPSQHVADVKDAYPNSSHKWGLLGWRR